jgi:hypothetical protein
VLLGLNPAEATVTPPTQRYIPNRELFTPTVMFAFSTPADDTVMDVGQLENPFQSA